MSDQELDYFIFPPLNYDRILHSQTINTSHLNVHFVIKFHPLKFLLVSVHKVLDSFFYCAGAHSVGRAHCINFVNRLYPEVDPTLNPAQVEYLKRRCPSPKPGPKTVEYARTDTITPRVLDNMYYKSILEGRGLLIVDQELASDNRTFPFVQKMAADNDYFHDQFSRALLILSENNPLSDNEGEIRKDCRFVNAE